MRYLGLQDACGNICLLNNLLSSFLAMFCFSFIVIFIKYRFF